MSAYGEQQSPIVHAPRSPVHGASRFCSINANVGGVVEGQLYGEPPAAVAHVPVHSGKRQSGNAVRAKTVPLGHTRVAAP
jgi:hypothetical protein